MQPTERDSGPVESQISKGWEESSRQEFLRKMEGLRDSGVDRFLHADILTRLVSVRRTALDLSQEIYPDDESRAGYMKVIRALGSLEQRGYVAKPLFGNEKPYSLTPYGRERLSAAIGGTTPRPLVSRKDLATYLSLAMGSVAAILLTSMALSASGWTLSPLALGVLWFAVGSLFGGSLVRFVETLRRVS
jgi:hypothetical protein